MMRIYKILNLYILILCHYRNYQILIWAFNSTTCHRLIPTEGTWVNHPPYWIPHNCKQIQTFGETETKRCMRGRTLYVIGNSVPRQMAFGMIELLGGGSVKREGQRDICPKHETFWGDSCHSEFANVKIRFLHLQFMDGYNYSDRGGFPFLLNQSNLSPLPMSPHEALDKSDENKFWEEDNCFTHPVRSCLQTFFNESKSDDILIFSIGMTYMNLGNKIIDMRSWIRSSASAFRSHLSATFHGHIFRFTGSQARNHMAHFTPWMKEVDEILWELWRPGSEADSSMWYTIDQWAINRDRDHLYNDHLHFVGPLTAATLYQVLNIVCPGQGNEVLEYYPDRIIQTDDGLHDYLMDSNGILHEFVSSKSCLASFQIFLKSDTLLHGIDTTKYERGVDILDVCSNGKLIKGSTRECFLMDDKFRRSFQSLAAFTSRKFSFDDVITVGDWQLSHIPIGEPLV